MPNINYAHAAAVDDGNSGGSLCSSGGALPRPSTKGISSNMGPRNLSYGSKEHKGTDYLNGCGEQMDGPPRSCKKVGGNDTKCIISPKTGKCNGYGYVAQFDCGNGIKLQYGHLQDSSSYDPGSNKIVAGGTGAGGAKKYGCHLDYVITIDGTVVDAQCATGTVSGQYTYGNSSTKHNKQCPTKGQVNLCDPTIRDALKQHSKDVFGKDKSYNIGDGPTGTGSSPDEDPGGTDTGTPVVLNQGTLGITGEGGGDGDDTVGEEPGPDPEEEEPETPEPEEPYDPKASKPVCDNSTCISQDMIDNANHERVKRDDAKTYKDFLSAEGNCKKATETGAEVFRQVVEGGQGRIVKYKDAFCTNEGCSYVTDGADKGGECK